jgi:type I restriction enzyme S subunit
LARITPDVKKNLPEYLYLCMCEFDEFQTCLTLNSRSAILGHITKETLLKIALPIPSLDGQKAILKYLDHCSSEIDSLIAALARQGELLDRYKRDLITNAVTHGLSDWVPAVDSEVDWIGEVPEHWSVTKMKWMFEIVKRIYGKEDRDVLSITQRGLKVKDIESKEGEPADPMPIIRLSM